MTPSYLDLHHSGELERRAEAARALQSPCRLCPRRCGMKRVAGERGWCRGGSAAAVFRAAAHFGEEPPVSGGRGSGAVFFSGCTLDCSYCQNYRFSREGEGAEIGSASLAEIFLGLQRKGCHNLNLVTPSHFLPQILSALGRAVRGGLELPIVYNTSGYESLATLRLLDRVVDIYLADMRYASPSAAARYSLTPDYPAVNRAAIREMWSQTGPLTVDGDGVAERGLIVRHLVLPRGVSGTESVFRFLATDISREVAVSVMSQYTPCHRAVGDAVLGRRITGREYAAARDCLERYGFENGWIQDWTEGPCDEGLFGATMEANINDQ